MVTWEDFSDCWLTDGHPGTLWQWRRGQGSFQGNLVVLLCICLCVHLYMKVHVQLCAYIYVGQRTTSSVMSQWLSIFTYLIFDSFMYSSPSKPHDCLILCTSSQQAPLLFCWLVLCAGVQPMDGRSFTRPQRTPQCLDHWRNWHHGINYALMVDRLTKQ